MAKLENVKAYSKLDGEWTRPDPPTFLGQTSRYKTTVGPRVVDPYHEVHV